jgi:hypothetical protein
LPTPDVYLKAHIGVRDTDPGKNPGATLTSPYGATPTRPATPGNDPAPRVACDAHRGSQPNATPGTSAGGRTPLLAPQWRRSFSEAASVGSPVTTSDRTSERFRLTPAPRASLATPRVRAKLLFAPASIARQVPANARVLSAVALRVSSAREGESSNV